jgi:hypothetical protein
MGILDDAIREHLELKRQHGADESEVDGLETEAFGPADRPDAAGPPQTDAEAMTQILSPGSEVSVPAGEGDQLDKVFAAEREEQAAAQRAEQEPAASGSEPSFAEHRIPDPPAAPPTPEESPVDQSPAPEHETAAEPDPGPAQAETPADPVAEAPGIRPETGERREDDGSGDAGDALEAERRHLAGQPTEHYDVDAAIAEEDEIDLLSESRLADELDRALEGPGGSPAEEPEPPAERGHEFEPETAAAPGPDEPVAPDREHRPESPSEQTSTDADQPDPDVVTGEVVEEEETSPADADFFDQDDPLEGTPDFLEETPEHDRLWFEQKEPKDFDFGD